MGWEEAGLQAIVTGIARSIASDRREKGESMPEQVGITQSKKKDIEAENGKVARIIACVSALLDREDLRFPHFDKVVTDAGDVFQPAPWPSRHYHQVLKRSLDTMTEKGCKGYIDLADALEMVIRISRGAKGQIVKKRETECDRILRKWETVGIPYDYRDIPPSAWTENMAKQYKEDLRREFNVPDTSAAIVLDRDPLLECNPYD
jgi:hypothetical protein